MLSIWQLLVLCEITAAVGSKPGPHKPKASLISGAAPAAAPGGAPGPSGAPGAPGPGAAPATFTENWGADSHKEEFSKEYTTFTRKRLREPHMKDQKWLEEMKEGPGEFDLDRDFVHDTRLESMNSGAYEGKYQPPPPKSGAMTTSSLIFILAVSRFMM